MSDLTYMKNFIKFLTITFYHKFEKKSNYTEDFRIEYLLTFNDEKLKSLNINNKDILTLTLVIMKFNKLKLKILNLSTLSNRKKEIFEKTKFVYLLSLKDEKLIPYSEFKIEKLSLQNLFSLQAKLNNTYIVKLNDVCSLINNYLILLKKYFKEGKINGFNIFYLLDDLFQIADHYFQNYKNLHFLSDYVFFRNYKYFEKSSKSEQFTNTNLDEEFNCYIELINKYLSKNIFIGGNNKQFKTSFKTKYDKTFDDILHDLNLYQDYKLLNEHFIFENVKKFNIQDFIIYLTILTNLLSI